MRDPAKPCKSRGSGPQPSRRSTARKCEIVHVSRTSWSHRGHIEIEFGRLRAAYRTPQGGEEEALAGPNNSSASSNYRALPTRQRPQSAGSNPAAPIVGSRSGTGIAATQTCSRSHSGSQSRHARASLMDPSTQPGIGGEVRCRFHAKAVARRQPPAPRVRPGAGVVDASAEGVISARTGGAGGTAAPAPGEAGSPGRAEQFREVLVPALRRALEAGGGLRALYLIEDLDEIEPGALWADTRLRFDPSRS
jgi:hypothetical protein